MTTIAMLGVTQAEAGRLGRVLSFEAEIILDDDTRKSRTAPLEVDVAICISFTTAEIAAVRCRLLQVSAIGVDGIAFDELPVETTVCNVGEHEIPVAEYVMLSILEHEIGLGRAAAQFSSSTWAKNSRPLHGEAAGKTIGLVGFGRIGRAVARRAHGFGMRVIAVNRSGQPSQDADELRSYRELNWLLEESDYLVLACPLTEETRGLIGDAELRRMKPTALLVNVARGNVTVEKDLYTALLERRIAGAVIDTWYRYPTAEEPEARPSLFAFEALENVRCTPHTSGWTNALMERRYKAIADNLARFNRGEPLSNVVWQNGAAVSR